MPANEVEIVAAEHEGIKFHFLAAPVRVVADDNDHVTHLEFLKMELESPMQAGDVALYPLKVPKPSWKSTCLLQPLVKRLM